jgi:hypothetical protein
MLSNATYMQCYLKTLNLFKKDFRYMFRPTWSSSSVGTIVLGKLLGLPSCAVPCYVLAYPSVLGLCLCVTMNRRT